MTIYNTNQCEHGSLERKCEICERDNEILELSYTLQCAHDENASLRSQLTQAQAELAAAKGQVERMREAMAYAKSCMGNCLIMTERHRFFTICPEICETLEMAKAALAPFITLTSEDSPATSKGEKKCELDHSVISSGEYCLSCGAVILRKKREV